MVQIVLRDDANAKQTEWLIVELQGVLEPKVAGTSLEGLTVGDVTFKPNGDPQLHVGPHQLDGKVVTLKKPLVLVEKDAQHDPHAPAFGVVGVVRKKYLFKTRPRPVLE